MEIQRLLLDWWRENNENLLEVRLISFHCPPHSLGKNLFFSTNKIPWFLQEEHLRRMDPSTAYKWDLGIRFWNFSVFIPLTGFSGNHLSKLSKPVFLFCERIAGAIVFGSQNFIKVPLEKYFHAVVILFWYVSLQSACECLGII